MRKGITPVIAVVLLLMITISLVGFAFIFLSDMFTGATEQVSESARQFSGKMQCIQLESVSQDKVYIRNCGSNQILQNDIAVYVNNQLLTHTMSTVDINVVGEVVLPHRIDLCVPLELKITTRGSEIIEDVNSCGAISVWHLDGDYTDSKGNNDGTCPTYKCPDCSIDGKVGRACRFTTSGGSATSDATDYDYIRVVDEDNELDNLGYEFTVMAWASASKVCCHAWSAFITKYGYYSGTDQRGIRLDLFNWGSMFRVFGGTSNKYVDYVSPVFDGWHHYVGVYDKPSNKIYYYVDSVNKGEKDISGFNIVYTPTDMGIGTRMDHGSYAPFDGDIDEVKIFPWALAHEEIVFIYSAEN